MWFSGEILFQHNENTFGFPSFCFWFFWNSCLHQLSRIAFSVLSPPFDSVPFQYTLGLDHPFYTKTRLTRYLCNQISQNCIKRYQTWLYEIIRFLKNVKFSSLGNKKKDPFHTKNEADQVSLQSDFSKLYQKIPKMAWWNNPISQNVLKVFYSLTILT